jgi:hypothetical protein
VRYADSLKAQTLMGAKAKTKVKVKTVRGAKARGSW